ncbi:MAG: tetraacyldisaccharide 4'-kinase, partial [Acidobacteria bacterium]|nr:tetraacyldisaccharide 4'-kinase [Acidobacteriota bacterium]
ELAPAVAGLLDDEAGRARTGARCRELAEARRGATARALNHIREANDGALVLPPRFNPLSPLWRAGVAVDRALSHLRLDLPGRPVVSVGNLAMGGTGKTPFVIWLCQRLAARGLKPAVLTRGYKRESSEAVTTLLPGESAPVAVTGEEPQLILRSGSAALAIGADRQAARWALEQRFHADVYVLDDGFQHWRMRRDLDIVLIDALDPFRGGVFPRGRLREPFSALCRAGAIVITRAEPGRRYGALVEEIRSHSPATPIFFASVQASIPELPPDAAIGAFCGLGQPESFRRTLSSLGIEPILFEQFPDHHRYSAADLEPLAARAGVLLTTEKDLLNIDPALAHRCRIAAVPARIEVDDEARLIELVMGCLAPAQQ